MPTPSESEREWKREGKKKLRTKKELLALARNQLKKSGVNVPVTVTRRIRNPRADATLIYSSENVNGKRFKKGSAQIKIHPVHRYTPASQVRSTIHHEAGHFKDLLKGEKKFRGKLCSLAEAKAKKRISKPW